MGWRSWFTKTPAGPDASLPPPPAHDPWAEAAPPVAVAEDEVTRLLARCVAERGVEYFTQWQRTRALLADVMEAEPAQIAALVAASEVGVVTTLAQVGTPTAQVLKREAGRISREKGIDSTLAAWAVGTWTAALKDAPNLPATPVPSRKTASPATGSGPGKPKSVFSLVSRDAQAPAAPAPSGAPTASSPRREFSLKRDDPG